MNARKDRLAQTLEIELHLKAGLTITHREAEIQFGCGRLSARIYDLREAGHDIRTDIIPVVKANGVIGRVGQYRLVAEA